MRKSNFTEEEDKYILESKERRATIAKNLGVEFRAIRNRRTKLLREKTLVKGKPLSKRETQVLDLMSEGYTNKEIGKIFDISYRTVETYRSNALSKLGAKNIAQAMRICFEKKILK